MIQSQGKKRNHPNVSAGVTTTNFNGQTLNRHREESKGKPPSKPGPEIGRSLKTSAAPASSGVPTKETTMPLKKKHCILHNMPGHNISECRAFESMTVREREEWIFQERLCYRCFSPNHIASACKESIKCSICGSERHPDLLHLSREDKKGKATKEREPPLCVETPEKSENVNPKCTSICKGSRGGLSCSKIVLVDIYNEDGPD